MKFLHKLLIGQFQLTLIYIKLILSSMLLPKIPSHKKSKLTLNQQRKSTLKEKDNTYFVFSEKNQKQNLQNIFYKSQQFKQKQTKILQTYNRKSLSHQNHSLKSKKLILNQKFDGLNHKAKKQETATVFRPKIRLSLNINKLQKSNQNLISQQFHNVNSPQYQKKNQECDKIREMQRSIENNNFFEKLNFENKWNENLINIENQNNEFKKLQSICIFEQTQNSKILCNKNEIPLKSIRRNSFKRSSIKQSRFLDNRLSLDYSVYSLKIENQNQIKVPKKDERKLQIIMQLLKDSDFQWKYQRHKQYISKYTEYEMQLKQNFQILQFMNDNLQLIKQRIIPFKSFHSLQEIVEMLKPTMTKKQKNAYQIKMEMLQWKKRFFTNAIRIKQKFSNGLDKKYQVLFKKLNLSQSLVIQFLASIVELQKKETVISQKDNFLSSLKELFQKLILSQKQMIDEIKICQSETQFLFQKFNSIEQQWSQAFDVFNSTLQNCVSKCFVLSDIIQSFFGKCQNASFLTKGFSIQNKKDLNMIQNKDCNICKWNQIKIKKIIEQNSLAKDHLLALKHLIAN